MNETEKNIITILMHHPGLSDGELAVAVKGQSASSKSINENCRVLESQRTLLRQRRVDGLVGNWLVETDETREVFCHNEIENKAEAISEKEIKKILSCYLTFQGWQIENHEDNRNNIDISARLGSGRWIIQVKGTGSSQPLKVNNFLSVLGEILQRMDDPYTKYSIAFPDKKEFHRLWGRLPGLAKSRIEITALFANPRGQVVEEC